MRKLNFGILVQIPSGHASAFPDKAEDVLFSYTPSKVTSKLLDLKRASGWAKGLEIYGNTGTLIFPSSNKNRLLILADYEKLYDDLVAVGVEGALLAMKDEGKGKQHGLVLGNTGTVGKSMTLSYIIYRRLLEGLPTSYRSNKAEVLHSSDGTCVCEGVGDSSRDGTAGEGGIGDMGAVR